MMLVGESSPGEDSGAVWPYNALGNKKPTPPTPRDIPVQYPAEHVTSNTNLSSLL